MNELIYDEFQLQNSKNYPEMELKELDKFLDIPYGIAGLENFYNKSYLVTGYLNNGEQVFKKFTSVNDYQIKRGLEELCRAMWCEIDHFELFKLNGRGKNQVKVHIAKIENYYYDEF